MADSRVYLFCQNRHQSVLIVRALGPDCVKMSVRPPVTRSAAHHTLQSSAADESLTAATNHPPPSLNVSLMSVVTLTVNTAFTLISKVTQCYNITCYIRNCDTECDVTAWPPMFCDHTGECGRESGQWLQFLPGPVTQYQELLLRPRYRCLCAPINRQNRPGI